ncbi:MAG: bifunctional UDP-N-acetylglucosamine diphosphorylase/glucosamine-1-phosphate N-acetyltransferase GlmU, partial [Chloroflexota bacterium]|nr:bifunctional UDP-N-acetylglucosamine diphosphorylase/glucosamine-1-phosphate N-acetyltransferase GlmU [Chloroflexota bacterium]
VTQPPPHRTIAVVLAAGLGTRMRSRLPKVLHPICGRPMLAYVLDAAREATGERPLVVYSPATAQIRDVFADEADFALQDEPRGTGDAVRAALEAVDDGITDLLVLNGDKPLSSPGPLRALLERQSSTGAAITLTTFHVAGASPWGRVDLGPDGQPKRILERKDDPGRADISGFHANAGVYVLDAVWLRGSLARIEPSPASGELYLTDLVAIAREDGRSVATIDASDAATSLAHVKDRVDLATAEALLQERIGMAHMQAGVSIQDPSTAFIDATVEIAEDVTLEPNVTLKGATRIGRDSVIKSGSYIVDSVIGERCTIWASVIEESVVEDDVRVGPFSHLRPGAHIGTGAEIGNFAEIKRASLGPRTKQHHFSYIGDAQVGADVNIGAGTITANYDGQRKHLTRIGDGAFIGSDTILRAPVEIGQGGATGAGSVVTRDVPPGMLAVGMPARIRERRAPEEPPEEAA